MKILNYTDRIEGFQIRDVSYLGEPPKDAPIEFDIVKWIKLDEPELCTSLENVNGKWVTEQKWHDEYCYSVGRLVWDSHEEWFKFESVGTRWLEENPSMDVITMILRFCNEKRNELII